MSALPWRFCAAPHLFAAPDELIRNKYLKRFEGELKKYVNDWFALPDGEWDAFAAEYRDWLGKRVCL